MELLTNNIQTRDTLFQSDLQITLEDDFNVADTKPDMEQLIKTKGNVEMTSIVAEEGKVLLKGVLSFFLLYLTNEDIRPIHSIKGQIPFEETLNAADAVSGKETDCHIELEDCQANMINSRKVSIRAIVSFHCCQENIHSYPIGTDIVSSKASRADMENFPSIDGLYRQFNDFETTQPVMQKKDILRIKDECVLPKGKPNVDTILYHELVPQNLQTRIIDDGIRILGDVRLFVLYIPDTDERKLEYLETELPFDSIISCQNCSDDLILDIDFLDLNSSLELKPDEDNENRIFDYECNLRLSLHFYRHTMISYLKDAYSTACSLSLQKQEISLNCLHMKNDAVVRVSDRLHITQESEKIDQICTSIGNVQIDEQEITNDGIALEGVINLEILYLTDNDSHPLATLTGSIPFTHLIEIPDIHPDDNYELQTGVNQISAVMLDHEEVDVKCVIQLSVLVFTLSTQNVIQQISEAPKDLNMLQEMPGLVGYIVDKEESLWDIAKKYNTTIDHIMKLNGLENDKVNAGDKLLLLKEVDGF